MKAVDPANQVGGPYLSFESKPLGSPDSSSQLQGPPGQMVSSTISAATSARVVSRSSIGHASIHPSKPE